MARIHRSDQPDEQVKQVLEVLAAYERLHPQARIGWRRHSADKSFASQEFDHPIASRLG